MLKTYFFDQKLHFFTQILKRSTCTHSHHSDLDSGGQIYQKMTKVLSAYAKTTCWWNSSRLYYNESKLPTSEGIEGLALEELSSRLAPPPPLRQVGVLPE